ncbi:TPA: hypothetical protein R1X42_001307 [Campylobacter upsaliensis]|nr:hypothetical protein [Campylobacter upsaliensis]
MGNTKLYIALGAMFVGLVIAGLYIRTLKLSFEASEEKDVKVVKVQKIKESIYREVERDENNLTKLFNAMVGRLWEQNATTNR